MYLFCCFDVRKMHNVKSEYVLYVIFHKLSDDFKIFIYCAKTAFLKIEKKLKRHSKKKKKKKTITAKIIYCF